jgi:hypothetical protein
LSGSPPKNISDKLHPKWGTALQQRRRNCVEGYDRVAFLIGKARLGNHMTIIQEMRWLIPE